MDFNLLERVNLEAEISRLEKSLDSKFCAEKIGISDKNCIGASKNINFVCHFGSLLRSRL